MAGTVIISHGFQSSPASLKAVALAKVAERRGWRVLCPDYQGHDALGLVPAVEPRCRQLAELAAGAEGPLLLVGSSMGAFVSGWVSREVDCAGMFLIAVPAPQAGDEYPFDLRANIPTVLVHGWADDRCPVAATITLARERELELLLVPGDHQLHARVDWLAAQFDLFLQRYEPAA